MKIAAFSDCHWLYKQIKEFPKADILIFAGDWCGSGESLYETYKFTNWFRELPYEYKVAIPWNHDIFCENNESYCKVLFKEAGATLLVDEMIELKGLKIYGTPWCPEFNNWAYMKEEKDLKLIFKQIPENLDILITHTPPKTICDPNGYGSEVLFKKIKKIKPKIHIFGHAHEGYGFTKTINTKFYNVSVCSDSDKEHNYTYEMVNPITTIEI